MQISERVNTSIETFIRVVFCLCLGAPLLTTLSVMTGCQADEEARQGPVEVELNFVAVVGDDPFECGVSYDGLGATESAVSFTDLRLYVHDVSLIDRDGQLVSLTLEQDGVWQHEGIALLDFEDGCENGNSALNTLVQGQVPAGQYQGLRFSVGVPAAMNSGETMLEGRGSPMNLSAMFWSWRSGYKYMRLDTDLPFYRVHLGASACDDDFNCDEPNIATFSFDSFDHKSEQVQLDLKTLLSDSDLTQNTEDTPPGCMGQGDDPDCQKIFNHFNLGEGGPSAFSVTSRSP